MPTNRETILAALHTLLETLSATALRGNVLPERITATGLIILRDGKPGEPEISLSPLTYFYELRAELEVVIQAGAGCDALFDTLTGSIGSVLAADRTLGGLCNWVEAEVPEPIDLPIEGAARQCALPVTVPSGWECHAAAKSDQAWPCVRRP